MHILVPVKRVIDYNVKVRVNSDGSGVETNGVKMSMNPFDEVAVEQAVRLREAGAATKVTVVACGLALSQDVLRTALAMGADAAILVPLEAAPDSLDQARILKVLVEQLQVSLVLCGKQAIDDDLGAVGPMLAGLLDWPQATSANQISIDGMQLNVVCDGDLGIEQYALAVPAVVSVDLRLCDPRLISLPSMMRAKKAQITTLSIEELALVPAPATDIVGMTEPAARPAGVLLADVEALILKLRPLLAPH